MVEVPASTFLFLLTKKLGLNRPLYRQVIREAAAEFTGVMLLIILGTGVDCQVVLSTATGVASTPKGVSESDSAPSFHCLSSRTPTLLVVHLSQYWMGDR